MFFVKMLTKLPRKSRKLQKAIIMEEMQKVKKDFSLSKASGLKTSLGECLYAFKDILQLHKLTQKMEMD